MQLIHRAKKNEALFRKTEKGPKQLKRINIFLTHGFMRKYIKVKQGCCLFFFLLQHLYFCASRSAKEAEEKIKKALEKGEVLPTEARFDSNCITPGKVIFLNIVLFFHY